MNYEGYHVAFDWEQAFPPVVLRRQSALELADVLQSHTITPVVVSISKPFIDRPEDPFFEASLLRALPGFTDDEIYRRLELSGALARMETSNQWDEVTRDCLGNYTIAQLFADNREEFMDLPIESEIFFGCREAIEGHILDNYDGVVFKGKAACMDSTLVISFRPNSIRYGEEEHLPL